MARIQMHRSVKSADYRFIDNRIAEMYSVGGCIVNLNKYLGPADTGPSTDATQPQITNTSERSIQDLLFQENRDRKYDTTVFPMRGIYTKADQDFDLSSLGLFLAVGTLFITFHLNDMVRQVGRKLMAGDVLELTNLVDDYADVSDIPYALKRYYVVSDCSWPSEGFSPLWYPHLWRCKLNPLVDSQEYKGILNTIKQGNTNSPIVDILSVYNKQMEINNAVIAQAESDVPKSGYDVEHLYTKQKDWDHPDESLNLDPETTVLTPKRGGYEDYLTGDGLAPNGYPVTSGITFPSEPAFGDYHLRTDYLPSRLFRYDGSRWTMVEDSQRTPLTHGLENKTLKSGFVNNENTYVNESGETQPELQALNQILRARPG